MNSVHYLSIYLIISLVYLYHLVIGKIPELDIQNLRQVKELLSHFKSLVRLNSTDKTPTLTNTAPAADNIAVTNSSTAVTAGQTHSTHAGSIFIRKCYLYISL